MGTALVFLIAAAAGVVVAFRSGVVPQNALPPCPFHLLTGLHCPGCGATRAVIHLAHGEIGPALSSNALFVLSLPVLAGLFLAVRRRTEQPHNAGAGRWPWIALAAVIVFTVLRNLPLTPFVWLAP